MQKDLPAAAGLPLLALMALLSLSCDGWVEVRGKVTDQEGLEYEECSVDLGEDGYGIAQRFQGDDFRVAFSTGPADRDFQVTVTCDGASESFSTIARPVSALRIDLGDVVLRRESIARALDVGALHPELHTVAATWGFRFLEYRVCSPEHCWSDTYLQCRDPSEGTVLETVSISELGYGHAVSSARPDNEAPPSFRIEVRGSHDDSGPSTLILRPSKSPCSYKLSAP